MGISITENKSDSPRDNSPAVGFCNSNGKSGKKKKANIFYVMVRIFIMLFIGAIILVVGMAKINNMRPYEDRNKLFEINKMVQNPGELAFRDKERMLILCVGLDFNRDERGMPHSKGSRTDTMFLLSVDKKAERLGILSIPRDTYVEISEKYGYDKINSAYSYGFLEAYERNGNSYEAGMKAGLKQTRETIEKFLEVRIDHVVLIKIDTARQLVDAIGGLTIDVEKDMDYDDNWGNLHIHLKKGRQRLNGTQAVGYGRFRHDEEGDWGRIRRQQQVIQALVNELKKPNQIMKINELAKIIKENLVTDFDVYELIDLANVYKSFDKKKIVKGCTTGSDDTAGDAMIIVPDEEENRRLVKRVLGDPDQLQAQNIRITIMDGSGVEGLAEKVETRLKETGFDVVEVTDINYPGEEETSLYIPLRDNQGKIFRTEILDHFQNPWGTALLLKTLRRNARVMQNPSINRDFNVDYTIILGWDFSQPLQEGNLITPSPGPTFFPTLHTGEEYPTYRENSQAPPPQTPMNRFLKATGKDRP